MSERRNVFSYYNGKEIIFADPLAVHRRLTRALDGNPNEVLGKVDLGIAGPPDSYASEEDYAAALEQERLTEPLRYEATERMVEAVRAAFDMAPFNRLDGAGATEEDCRAALDTFIVFMEGKKKAPVNSPTSSPLTAPPSPPPSSAGNLPPTTVSACG